jgi:hypothetical protein
MNTQNIKTKIKSKTAINNMARLIDTEDNPRARVLLVITFFSSILLIISSYAWLSVSMNVKVEFVDLIVSSDSGLFISLDGIEYSDSVVISLNSVITDLKDTYPSNTNQWAVGGLWPVSSNGIRTPNNDKFDIYFGEISRYPRTTKKYLNTTLVKEDAPKANNIYLAFDLFLKNVSGSPKNDNLYLKDTFVDFGEHAPLDFNDDTFDDTPEEIKTAMSGIMNSMRFGFVKVGSVSSKSSIGTIQNIQCNNNCQMIIYEPNYLSHSEGSIAKAAERGITLVDGIYNPTYAVINEGLYLEHTNGQEGSGIPLDTAHFTLQNAITNFSKPMFQIPNGVTKVRTYFWLEGQDVDSLETNSKGANVYLMINFEKDLAGYEE